MNLFKPVLPGQKTGQTEEMEEEGKEDKRRKKKTANESVECGQQKLANQRHPEKGKLAKESVTCRQKKLQTHQECRITISNSLTIAKAVHKFYAAVSRGQLSICSCCNQFACGISTVLLMLKGREFPILMKENIE